MTTTGEPLSEERLAELSQTFTRKTFPNGASIEPTNALVVRELLAEVERQRAEREALLTVVRAVASGENIAAPFALIEQARALLAIARPDAPGRE